MEKDKIIAMIEEKRDLAERAYNSYQQLQGQIYLLKSMLKEIKDTETKEPTKE